MTAYADNGPINHGRVVACANRCVLVAAAVSRDGHSVIAVQHLQFDASYRGLVPPDGFVPAADACGDTGGAVATIDVNSDVPFPRCLMVRSDQRVRVVNTTNSNGQTGHSVTLTWPPFATRTLAVGESTVYQPPVGRYLARGVHSLGMSIYAGGGGEVWFRQ